MVVGSLISPLSLSLWWPHGCGFCSGSVIEDMGFLWVCWSFVGFGLDCWFGSVVGWSVADCQKATEEM